ncbi:MAG: hypothetical protein JWR22_933 [Herminiimonas sp.]|nr:hypothetical protein [Herminiimonas sp.]
MGSRLARLPIAWGNQRYPMHDRNQQHEKRKVVLSAAHGIHAAGRLV